MGTFAALKRDNSVYFRLINKLECCGKASKAALAHGGFYASPLDYAMVSVIERSSASA